MAGRTQDELTARIFPSPVATYVLSLLTLAAGAVVAAARLLERRSTVWFAVAGLGVLMCAAEWLIVRFPYRGETMALTLFEAMLAPAIFLIDARIVLALVIVAQLVAGMSHRLPAIKIAFNVAQWTIAAAVGTAAFQLLRAGGGVSARNMLALVGSMSAVVVVNAIAFVGVITIAERQRPRAIARSLGPAILLGWIVNTAFGAVFVASANGTVLTIGLFFVPLVVLHQASRGHAAVVADKARLSGMHRAIQTLAAPIDPQDAIPRFLAEVRTCFEAEVADLVLLQEGGRAVHRIGSEDGSYERRIETADVRTLAALLTDRVEPVKITNDSAGPTVSRALEREGWRDCLAAPLISEGRILGLVCVYNSSGPEGFEDGELAVLRALAGEAAGMIQKGRLLEAIIEERAKLAEIVNSTSDGIMTIGADGTVLTWNPSLQQITGYASAQMVGSRLLSGLRPRDTEGRDVFIERWAASNDDPPSDLQILSSRQDVRWLSCSYARAYDADGNPRLLIVVARDITKIREVEVLKDDFVATVSHELRTPLTPIRGWANMLRDHGDRLTETERRAAAESIMRQAEGLERLITNLLEVSRVERGAHETREQLIDVSAIGERVVNELREQNPERTIVLEAEQRCIASGDDMWVERIVANLISNAIKYAPASQPIDVRVEHDKTGVRVHVVDRGPGIPAHETDRIFDRFSRLGDHMTRAQGGAGLGLYIARQLATAIGGDLSVDSNPGVETTFTLSLRGAPKLAAVG